MLLMRTGEHWSLLYFTAKSFPLTVGPRSPLDPEELQVLRAQYEKEGAYVGIQTKFNFAWVRDNGSTHSNRNGTRVVDMSSRGSSSPALEMINKRGFDCYRKSLAAHPNGGGNACTTWPWAITSWATTQRPDATTRSY